MIPARLVYMLAVPVSRSKRPEKLSPLSLEAAGKSIPYFLELDIDMRELAPISLELNGQHVSSRWQLFDEEILIAESEYLIPDVLDAGAAAFKQQMNQQLREKLLAHAGYAGWFIEEYSAVCISGCDGQAPDEFVNKHLLQLASLIQTEGRVFTQEGAERAMISRVRYATRDIAVVDWEGAVVIDLDGDFAASLGLLKIGNSQLLRYRVLDKEIERNLELVRHELERKRKFGLSARVLKKSLESQLELLVDFERIDQRLLLIGDWYTAECYRVIFDEFYLDDWKEIVNEKLERLDSITSTVRENFSLDWSRLSDWILLVGWMVLLVGYLFLLAKDLGWIYKH